MDESLSYTAQAENSLAGCLLVEPERTAAEIRGLCSAEDFTNEQARAVYTVALYLLGSGKPCDPVTIQAEAAARGISLDTAYCAELMRLYTTTANAAETARILHAEGMKRRARAVGHVSIVWGQGEYRKPPPRSGRRWDSQLIKYQYTNSSTGKSAPGSSLMISSMIP